MDWDFFIPPKDADNFTRLNSLLEPELDQPLVPLGARGENFVQTYQMRWGVVQFHLGLPGVPRFDEAEKASVARQTEQGTPVFRFEDERGKGKLCGILHSSFSLLQSTVIMAFTTPSR
jgi:hypothetical protein